MRPARVYRDDGQGRDGADAPRQQADPRSDERRAGDDERHAVADAEWVALKYAYQGSAAAATSARTSTTDARARDRAKVHTMSAVPAYAGYTSYAPVSR